MRVLTNAKSPAIAGLFVFMWHGRFRRPQPTHPAHEFAGLPCVRGKRKDSRARRRLPGRAGPGPLPRIGKTAALIRKPLLLRDLRIPSAPGRANWRKPAQTGATQRKQALSFAGRREPLQIGSDHCEAAPTLVVGIPMNATPLRHLILCTCQSHRPGPQRPGVRRPQGPPWAHVCAPHL